MATTDDNALFIDTNILIYANVVTAPLHTRDIPCLLAHNVKDFKRFDKIIAIEHIDGA